MKPIFNSSESKYQGAKCPKCGEIFGMDELMEVKSVGWLKYKNRCPKCKKWVDFILLK